MGGFERFYKSIKEKTDPSLEKGKVFVQFVVDTTGRVQCARAIRSDNKLLDSIAINLLKETEFVPAKQRGRKVISTMVLPITFGLDPPKEKKKNSKR